MNIQFKSFIHLLHCYPLPVLGNILGLAVAIAAFIIISMEVDYNRSFDGDIRDVDRLFELTAYTPAKNSYSSHHSRPFCEALAPLSPHIETVTFRNFYWPTKQRIVLNDTEINTDYCTVADNYFDVFGFDWIDCDTTAFTDPLACFLPESMALNFYGTTQLVKQPVNPSDLGRYIGGVYRDFPENSSVANTIYAYMGDENKGVQNNHNYLCYIKLHDTARRASPLPRDATSMQPMWAVISSTKQPDESSRNYI